MNHDSRRTLIFGLDGGTWDVLNPLLQRGLMPHLKRLQEQGLPGYLQSVVPVNSAAAWSTFLTGMAPEQHGVYDFLAWLPNHSRRTAVNATWLPRPTIFDLLKEKGPILSLKVPLTYPPWAINGAMVSGLPTPDDESAFATPSDLAARLNPLIHRHSAGRSWEVDSHHREPILDQMDFAQQSLERMTDYLLHRYPDTKICFVVARDVDELQHFFWDALTASTAEDAVAYQPRLEAYFSRLDGYLGRLLDWVGPEGRVLVLSDHGFGPIEGLWHLNEWLRTKGFLSLKPETEKSRQKDQLSWGTRISFALRRRCLRELQRLHLKGDFLERSLAQTKLKHLSQADLQGIDWGGTTAYAGNVGEEWLPLYLNLQGREPWGTVPRERYKPLREDLRRSLLKNSRPQVKAVHRSEEVFQLEDPRNSSAPDLLIETVQGGVQSDFQLNTPRIYELSHYRKACHRRQGMFLLWGPEINGEGQKFRDEEYPHAHLWDIPATILAWHGVGIPGYFRGRPLVEYIGGLAAQTRTSEIQSPLSQREFLSHQDETGVRRKLESLGYL